MQWKEEKKFKHDKKKENKLIITPNEKHEIPHMQKAQCTHLKKSMN
jgi:hypothetical protein